MHLRRPTVPFTRLRSLAVLTLIAFAAALAGWITCTGGGDDDPAPRIEMPIERQQPSDGWQPVDVPPLDNTYKLTAKKQDDAGIARDTAFVLESSARDLDRDRISELLLVDPPVEFDADGDGAKLTVRPRVPLREGARYRFTLLNAADRRQLRSWAFETEAPLRIVQTLPADEATNVPLDTGIELTFSHDGFSGVEGRFSIVPAVEGRFEVHKRVVVFVPERLEPETLYTVTIAPGAQVDGTDLATTAASVFSFETGATERQEQQPMSAQGVFFARLVFEAPTGEAPALQMDTYADAAQLALPFEIYRYDAIGAFVDAISASTAAPRWSYYARRDFRLEAAGLDRVASFTADIAAPSPNNAYQRYVIFPEALDPGFYLVQALDDGEPVQALLQVTDLASYASMSESKTIVWVNDLATGAPIEGAKVRDDAGKAFETNVDGVALFDTPESLLPSQDPDDDKDDDRTGVLRVEHDGRSAVLPLNVYSAIGYYGYDYGYVRGGGYYGGGSASPDYWTYLYPDRSLYHPSDEIHVWGVAKLREGFEPGESLTVRLSGGDYYDSAYRASLIAETAVSASDLGTFEGSLRFEGVTPGGYQLSVHAGDETVSATYIQILNFVKPAYKLEVTPSRRAVYGGEQVTIDIAARFFEGSPMPFVELGYYGPEATVEQRITTDAEGAASMTYPAVAGDPFSGPVYRGAQVYPIGPEQGEIYGSTTLYVLPSALSVRAQSETKDGRATITGNVHDVDLAAFDEGEDGDGWYGDFEGAPSAGRAIAANVVEITYNKVEIGEHYDFIAKLTRKEYRYDEVKRPLGAFNAVSDADGAFSFGFTVERDRSYDVEIRVTDDAGRVSGTHVYVSGGEFPIFNYGQDGRLHLDVTDTASRIDPYSYYVTERFAEGEAVDVTVRRDGVPADAGPEYRYLYVRARDGIRDYVTAAEPRLRWDFRAEDVPSVSVAAVQFNGRGYEQVSGEYGAQFDFDGREIALAVTADAERYEPGDDVTLSIDARDAEGRPVVAEALLSLVDEAIFRLQGSGYEQDILAQLYLPLSSGVLQTYVPSYTAVQELRQRYAYSPGGVTSGPDTGGSRSGIGAPQPRADFRDLALFRAVRTDADGKATVTFTLPDNITSWRVTSRAVTGDLFAGAAVTELPVGLPFFIEVTASDEYLTADRPVIELRAFGRELDRGDAVEYSIVAPSLGLDGVTVSGEAFTGADFSLPPLTDGEHEITVRALSGALGDAIVRTLRVVPSRLRRGEARFYELSTGLSLEGAAEGRTNVVFTDNNRGRYYDDVVQLGWNYGDRVDQMMARALARGLLTTYFDAEAFTGDAEFDASLYQTEDGGIALFPYADDELLLSARMASVAPDEFGRNGLAQYFREVLDDPDETRERSIIALFGLAAAGEPALPAIDAFASEGDLTPRERLYLGLAALAAGDEDEAREQYREVVARYGESRAPFVRVRIGVDQDDILELTALAANLGAGIGDPSAAAMFEYTQVNRTTDLLVELEQLSYLARALPALPSAPVKFSYNLRGQREEQTLAAGASFALTLSHDELRDLAPRAIEGAVGVATFFEAAFDPATAALDADVTVTRIVDVDGGRIREGDIVQVRLDYNVGPQALDGCYQITDIAPSGLRPITRAQRPYDGIETLYPYRVDGQRVSFCVDRRYVGETYYPAGYYARVVTKGDYAVEPAIIQSQQSAESFNFAPAASVSIE